MNNRQKTQKIGGFTLIELMIVIAIVAVLVSISLPVYTDHIQKARRIDAISELLELSATQEKNYAQNSAFIASTTTSNDGYYTIVATVTATSYTLTATAIGDQVKDTDCAVLTYTNLGVRSAVNSDSDPETTCW